MVQPYLRLSKVQLPIYLTAIFAVSTIVVYEGSAGSSSSNRSVVLKQSIEKIVLTKKTPSQVNIMTAIKQDEVQAILLNLIICKSKDLKSPT